MVWAVQLSKASPELTEIRQGLDRLLSADVAVTHEERIRRAIEAAGRFRSGDSDVSVDHDRYLAEGASA